MMSLPSKSNGRSEPAYAATNDDNIERCNFVRHDRLSVAESQREAAKEATCIEIL